VNARGWIICTIGLLYGMTTTAFFGNNLFPKSPEECITDGIVLVIVAIGIATKGGSK
jgi:hypothetical protein